MGKTLNNKEKFEKRLYQIVEVGYTRDFASRAYDFIGMFAIIINLSASVMYTFGSLRQSIGSVLLSIENITVFFFAVDYVLRLLSSGYKFRELSRGRALLRYIISFEGVIDLLSFLPYYLPVFFPGGAVAFRMFRIIRILRLFRLNAYYDSLNVITNIIKNKGQQLLSSMFIILVLMLASSLCMYSVEHEAQPDVFENAFSGIWWAASALLTVGYGDIYPVTYAGRILGTIIAFLGVGVVAVPTGIISAGFVEQYTLLKQFNDVTEDSDINFIKVRLDKDGEWTGKQIKELDLPRDIIIAGVERDNKFIMPRGDMCMKEGDMLIMAAEGYKDEWKVELKELILAHGHPWCGCRIDELNISRKTFIVMLRREDKMIVPNGSVVLDEGDVLIVYSERNLPEAAVLRI
ncbi:MAG: ion transporter [Lachnospiraceae bacterium]|nr:ion transporter [Lachnospiraceae bacterium]